MIGNRIKLARKHRKRSQAWLAEQVGVHQTSVTQWETGRTDPTTENLSRIANELNVNFEWLAKGTGTMTGLPSTHPFASNIVFYQPVEIYDDDQLPEHFVTDATEFIGKAYGYYCHQQKFDDLMKLLIALHKNNEIIEFLKLFNDLPKSKRGTLLTFMREWVK